MMRARMVVLQSFFFLILSFSLALPGAEARLIGKAAPEIKSDVWLNSSPLRVADLRGRVVLMVLGIDPM